MTKQILIIAALFLTLPLAAQEFSKPLMQREYSNKNAGEYECEIKESNGKYFVFHAHDGEPIGKSKEVQLTSKDFEQLKTAVTFNGKDTKTVTGSAKDKPGFMTYAKSGSMVRYAVRKNSTEDLLRLVLIAKSGSEKNSVEIHTRGYKDAGSLASRIDQLCQ